MPSVKDSWGRICSWLRQHAPKVLNNLNAAAPISAIEAAQRAIGYQMPAEWRELYALCDGMNTQDNVGSLFFGMNLLPLDEVVREHQEATAGGEVVAVKSADASIRKDELYNLGWIRLAHDFGESCLSVDMAPAPGGQVGQVIYTDHASAVCILVAPGVAQLLSDFANDLEGGRYFLNPEAIANGNEFLDCVEEIDIVNWWKSARWRHRGD